MPADAVVVSTFVADVSDEAQLVAFREHVAATHDTDHIDLLFNNAGIGGGASLVADPREEWDQVFAVCWGGVYLGTRTFLPMLLASTEGHVVNTSSVNGFWATLGGNAHTAYSAAKFAVKGFTEALISDFRQNAPHLRASVVMPGHIGTSIVFNSGSYFGRDPKELSDTHVAELRRAVHGPGPGRDAGVRRGPAQRHASPSPRASGTTPRHPPPQAATIILDGVRAGDWRILVGEDAHRLDEAIRADPTEAYEPEFFERLRATGIFGNMPVAQQR